jgi:hypothetical protein
VVLGAAIHFKEEKVLVSVLSVLLIRPFAK